MIDYKALNEFKKQAFATKTPQEYEQWKNKFKAWFAYHQQTLNENEKQQIAKEITELNEKKLAYFNKYQNKKQFVPKSSYIFREETEKHLCEMFDAIAAYYRNASIPHLYPISPQPLTVGDPVTQPYTSSQSTNPMEMDESTYQQQFLK